MRRRFAPARLVGVKLVLVGEFFVLEKLVLFGEEFLERRPLLEANRPLIGVRQSKQRALVVSATRQSTAVEG